ncbi:MAG: helix-turn-helix domain-containing protein, partial [Cyclobacteriaceae bacterium]
SAAGSERAVLFGHSEGGSVSTLFAATYPEKVISLITFGVFAKRRYSPDYPWAPKDEERQKIYDMIENRWGRDNMGLETLAPSKADDVEFMNWLSGYFRFGASPNAAMVLTRMNTEVNIIDILGSVKVPTMIMQRTNDIDVKIEEGRFMSRKIKGSKLVEFEGNDHLFWVGNTKEVLTEMKSFIHETKVIAQQKTGLVTFLSANISSKGKEGARFETISSEVRKYQGKIATLERDRLTILFKGSERAVNCGIAISNKMKELNIDMCAAIYLREVPLTAYGRLEMPRDEQAEKMLSLAHPNQLLITQDIKHLLSGVALSLTKQNTIYDGQHVDACTLYQVHTSSSGRLQKSLQDTSQTVTFLESILQIIDKYLDDESFGVATLSKETGVSERQLQRKIKNMTKKSPNQLITSVRLNRAKEMLLLQQHTVAEIAFSTGFSSPSYFSKCFKKEFGISPTSMF